MITSRGLAPPKMDDCGFATAFIGAATERGLSCKRGLPAVSAE